MASLRDSDAAHYITTPDFETVATLAGVDPDAVRYAFNRGLVRRQSSKAQEHKRAA